MEKISLCNLHIPLDVAKLTFTGSRSRSSLKIKLQNNINLKLKKVRTEGVSNRECPAAESSTLTIIPQKTSHFVEYYSPNNS